MLKFLGCIVKGLIILGTLLFGSRVIVFDFGRNVTWADGLSAVGTAVGAVATAAAAVYAYKAYRKSIQLFQDGHRPYLMLKLVKEQQSFEFQLKNVG